jgi:hypothetical protein
MPTADKERTAADQKETEARVSILHWAEARRERDRAQAALEAFGDQPGSAGDAQNAIDVYQNACDAFDAAEKGLGKAGGVPKPHRERYEERIARGRERAGWHAMQEGRSYDAVLQAQQDHERRRIMLENEQARLAAEARRGPMIAAPGTESHPPSSEVVLDRFQAPVTDPFAASKPREGVDTHYQDASRTQTDAPGLASRKPAEQMTAGEAAETEALVKREVEQRGQMLQQAERASAPAVQGEHQQGGAAHGRVENKQGGYKEEKKGARPEPVPGPTDKPSTEKDKP